MVLPSKCKHVTLKIVFKKNITKHYKSSNSLLFIPTWRSFFSLSLHKCVPVTLCIIWRIYFVFKYNKFIWVDWHVLKVCSYKRLAIHCVNNQMLLLGCSGSLNQDGAIFFPKKPPRDVQYPRMATRLNSLRSSAPVPGRGGRRRLEFLPAQGQRERALSTVSESGGTD